MSAYRWSDITRQNVVDAIRIFLEENPEFPAPRNTFLVYENRTLPAKHIRGMAYKVAFGEEIPKSGYSGGGETAKFFERLGFEVAYKDASVVPSQIPAGNPSETHKTHSFPPKEGIKKKIKISSKDVIEQKNALQLLLNRIFSGDVVCEKTYDWLKTPENITGAYSSIYNALHHLNGDTSFAKKNVTLRCDFVSDSHKIMIEYDERQHFSIARAAALEAYPSDIELSFDKELWKQACLDIKAKDGNPANRDEIRAFYDSTRDIEAAKHGYKLVRIMHGQFDWSSSHAEQQLRSILFEEGGTDPSRPRSEDTCQLKIGLYLQTETAYDRDSFESAMGIAEQADFDILVFPENCYFPDVETAQQFDIAVPEDHERMYNYVLALSRRLNKAVILSSTDVYGTLYSIYANDAAGDDETQVATYIKHTMTDASAFDFTDYRNMANKMFTPILYQGVKIGMTICYDCNHAIFSRMWGVNGVDIIINSTGGDVVYDKWYKFNKVRAIENHCYTFVTMGGAGQAANPHSYVYGFNREGKELPYYNLMGKAKTNNLVNTIYVFDISQDDGTASIDTSINQVPTRNKNSQFGIPVGSISDILDEAAQLNPSLYVKAYHNENIVFCVADGMTIMQPEKVLTVIYDKQLRKFQNKRYVLVNRHNHLDINFYRTKLSPILKVRAMENFCAVILESDTENRCYQCGNNRTAQLVAPYDGIYELDLARTGGPEVIWKNKTGMKADWRNNYEWLIDTIPKQ